MADAPDFAAQLDAILKARGVSRAKLARRLGCSRVCITKVLRGTGNVGIRTMRKYAAAVGYDVQVTLVPRGVG